MSAMPERDDAQASEGRWVAVVRVEGVLWAVGPLPAHSAALAAVGLVEGWPGAERVGVAELVPPAETAERLSQAQRDRGGQRALRPLRRDGEETP
ncbi:MAG: hypothetical protein ACRDZO_07700 [Egibacteraceae bacterium]